MQKHCFMSFKLLSLAEMEQIICVQLKTGSLLNYRLCADNTGSLLRLGVFLCLRDS